MSQRLGLAGSVLCALALGGCLDAFVFDRDGAADGAIDVLPTGDVLIDSGCPTGEHLCNGTCVDSHAVATCGALCTPCAAAPATGTATCDGTTCGFTCGVGYVASSGLCAAVAPPRPTAPLSTSTTTSTLPLFHWALAPGSDGAHVQVYRDRACTQLVTEFNATGSSGAPPVALSGVVFWRLQSRASGTTLAGNSPVWQVNIGQSSGTANTSSGTTLDVNGDGYADVAVGSGNAVGHAGTTSLYIGGSTGLPTSASVTLTAPNGGYFGNSVASAGDVNGDGYADLIVGAFGANGSAGEAYLYAGSSSGLPLTPTATLHAPSGGYFGVSVASAGDVNGDGFGDVVVGAWGVMGNAGAVYVYFGSSLGPTATPTITLASPGGGAFGVSVASAGDVNGDGFGDVVVGARLATGGAGQAYVFNGSAAGTATTPSTTLSGHGAADAFGVSVASAGDVNHDGLSDVVVGASGVGAAYVYLGSSTGVGTTVSYTLTSTAALFGFSVSGAGDVNHDGYSDVIVGALGANSNSGQAFLFLSSAGALPTSAQSTMSGSGGEQFGFSVAAAGDVNRDGAADVLVGAPANGSTTNAGHTYLYLGNAAGLGATPSPSITLVGTDVGGSFGGAVARASVRRSVPRLTPSRPAPSS